MAKPLRIASVNVNGIRASFKNGMAAWLDARDVDILALQEVRATTEIVQDLLGPEWDILHDGATAKGRAGVALASRAGRHGKGRRSTASPSATRTSTARAAGSRPTTRWAAGSSPW